MPPIGADAAGIGHQRLRLSGHVCAGVPGVGEPVQRDRRAVRHVACPAGLRGFRRLDGREAGLAHLSEAIHREVDMLLDRDRHVRQHRWAAGAGDQEQIREVRNREPQIALRTVRPDLVQRFAAAPGDGMHGADRAGHGIEAGREHDDVDVEAALAGLDAGRGDGCDRLLAQIDQGHVRSIERRVVVGVEAGALGAERMIVRRQCRRRLRILRRSRAIFSRISASRALPSASTPWSAHSCVSMPTRSPDADSFEALAALRLAHLHAELGRGGIGTPVSDQRACSRSELRSCASCAARSAGSGPLCAGSAKFGVRWNTVSCAAWSAMIGIDWMADEPVPITATRLPLRSTPSWGQRPVK